MAQPRPGKPGRAGGCQHPVEASLAGRRGGTRKRQRNGPQVEIEQPVAGPRLVVVVALGLRVRDQLDLACVEPEALVHAAQLRLRSEEHTSELQSLMRSSYAVFCLKKKTYTQQTIHKTPIRHNIAIT